MTLWTFVSLPLQSFKVLNRRRRQSMRVLRSETAARSRSTKYYFFNTFFRYYELNWVHKFSHKKWFKRYQKVRETRSEKLKLSSESSRLIERVTLCKLSHCASAKRQFVKFMLIVGIQLYPMSPLFVYRMSDSSMFCNRKIVFPSHFVLRSERHKYRFPSEKKSLRSYVNIRGVE